MFLPTWQKKAVIYHVGNNVVKKHIWSKFKIQGLSNTTGKQMDNKLRVTSEIKRTLTHYDIILKELQIIETIFHSQMNPELHLGSGKGLLTYLQ